MDGTIKVAPPPPALRMRVQPAAIELSWPEWAVSFVLQAQTNAAGIGSNWVDVQTGGQSNQFILSPVPKHQNVFFRLIAR